MNKKNDQYDFRNGVLVSGIAITVIIFFITLIFPSYPKTGSNGISWFIGVLFPLISGVCFYLFHDPDIQKQKWREPTTPYSMRENKTIRIGVLPGPIHEIYKDQITALEVAKYFGVNPDEYVVHCPHTYESGNKVTNDISSRSGELLLLVRRIV